MSSRSIGVTNVEFSRWMMSCVMRSPSCSQTTMSRASEPWSGHCWSSRSSSSVASTMVAPASSNRSTNSRSLGANSWDSEGIDGPVYVKGLSMPPRARSGGRGAAAGQLRAQPLHLLRRDAVGVLGPGEAPRADLLGVLRHATDHLLLHVGVTLDELGLEALVDLEQVVQHEHLAVGARTGADADDRHVHVAHDHVGDLGGDRLE